MRIGLGLGVNKGRKSGFVQDAAITALIDQADTDGNTAFSGDVLTASNTLVTDLKSAGIWDKLDLFYVFATNGDEAFARYNWKDPSAFQCTEVGAGALTFTSNEGFTTDGTNYLDTGFNHLNDTVNFTLNSASFGFYTTFNAASSTPMGVNGSTQLFARVDNDGTFPYRVNSNSSVVVTSPANSSGFWHANRESSSVSSLYQNGNTIHNGASNSLALVNANFVLFKDFGGPTVNEQLGLAFVGADLKNELTDFNSAVQQYFSSI